MSKPETQELELLPKLTPAEVEKRLRACDWGAVWRSVAGYIGRSS